MHMSVRNSLAQALEAVSAAQSGSTNTQWHPHSPQGVPGEWAKICYLPAHVQTRSNVGLGGKHRRERSCGGTLLHIVDECSARKLLTCGLRSRWPVGARVVAW